MKFAFEENSTLAALLERMRETCAAMLEGVVPVKAREILPVSTNLYGRPATGELYLLREGSLTVSFEDREIYLLEEGDVVFGEGAAKTPLAIQSDFATILDVYSFGDILLTPKGGKNLITLVSLNQALLAAAVAAVHRGEKKANPSIRTLAKGEVLCTEGELSDHVFTLLEGHATVSTGGETIGEIHADEMIGVIGALCGVPRIATVTASVDSLVMSLGKDDFIELLSLRPHTVIKLIENFARIISTGNQQIKDMKTQAKICQGF